MPAIKLSKFGGMLPAWDDLLLPEGQAALSINCYPFSGNLIGWRQPKLLYTLLSGTTKYAYRIPSVASNNTNITAADSFWMEFDDADTNVMRSPVVNDSFSRYYFASPSQPPQYNTYARIVAGQNPWLLGVPACACSPGVVVTGGGDTIVMGFTGLTNPSTGFIYANQMNMVPIIPAGTLSLQDVTFLAQSTNASVNMTGVLYSDNAGKPFQVLGSSVQITGCTAGTNVVLPFGNSISVNANTQYWVGVMVDQTIAVQIADTTTNRTSYVSTTYSNGPPAYINTPSIATTSTFNMWADFTGSGTSVFEARAYTYTQVTAYGEEGPPAPPTLLNGWSNGVWTVSLFTPVATDMGVNRNITTTRIYRSVSSNTGLSSYFLVAEVPVNQATYVDTLTSDVVALNSQLSSTFWFGPPADLQGIMALPNGTAVGFRSNEVWFSEAYRPHAWPPGYVITTEFPIVGLGVCGQSVVVCTQGPPYIITGVNPSVMSLTKIHLPEPCLYRGSIISTDTSVLYVSKNGLIQISQSGAASNVTEQWITRERWQALTPQKFVRAIKHASSYFAFGTVSGTDSSAAQSGYTVELSPADQTSFTIWPQAGGHRLGFSQLTGPNNFNIYNVMCDPWTGVGLLLQNNAVYYYDFTDVVPTIVPYKWRSKIYQQQTKKNFEALKVFFTVPPNTPAQSAVRNVNATQPALLPGQYAIVRIYADNALFTTREVRSSGELLRILSGSKVEQWQVEVEGIVNISNMQFATSVKELGLI